MDECLVGLLVELRFYSPVNPLRSCQATLEQKLITGILNNQLKMNVILTITLHGGKFKFSLDAAESGI